MTAIPVSVIVMTKDEEANIAKCLQSLTRFDEVFVVDSGSSDRTTDIARDMGATVVPFAWNGEYPKKKQWCLVNLPFRNPWVMYVDGDELVTPQVAAEIERTLPQTRHSGLFVTYDYVFLGRVMRYGRRVSKLILMRPERAAFAQLDDLDSENAGEVELHYQPTIQGSVGRLSSRMVHDDHDSLYHYFDRQNRYSDWEALVRSNDALISSGESGIGVRTLLKRAFAKVPLKGVVAFVHSYILRAGFLDGRVGFHYALSLGFYYWQIELKRAERAATTR